MDYKYKNAEVKQGEIYLCYVDTYSNFNRCIINNITFIFGDGYEL